MKLKLKCTEFPYLRHLVTKEGLKPDPDKIKAVQEMPRPDNIKAVRRFCGFVNYLAKFMPKLSEVMESIRNLTCKENDAPFKRIKEMATTSPLLKYYNPEDELTIQSDASEKGHGAAVLQKGQPFWLLQAEPSQTQNPDMRRLKRNFSLWSLHLTSLSNMHMADLSQLRVTTNPCRPLPKSH